MTYLDFRLCLRLVLDCVCLFFGDLGEKCEENGGATVCCDKPGFTSLENKIMKINGQQFFSIFVQHNQHDHNYDHLNMGFERMVTMNLPAGTNRKAKISSVDVIKLNSKKITTGCPKKTQ